MNKKFEITFTENKKYNSATRTIIVETDTKENAERLIHMEHGSFNKNGEPSKKITITSSKEIKEKTEKTKKNKKKEKVA